MVSAATAAAAPAPLEAPRETSANAESDAINAILARLGELAHKIEAQGDRIDRIETARPEPPADLAGFKTQIEELAGIAGDLTGLPGGVRRLDAQVKTLSATLKALGDELNVLRARIEATAAASSAQEPEQTPSEGGTSAGSEVARAWAQGVKLFKENRFKEALGIFNRLQSTTPDDARVWYYAALSLGFATGHWDGGTRHLVEKGIERERLGTPSTSAIDAAFSDLPPALGRDWLSEYRRRAASRPAGGAATPARRPGPGESHPN